MGPSVAQVANTPQEVATCNSFQLKFDLPRRTGYIRAIVTGNATSIGQPPQPFARCRRPLSGRYTRHWNVAIAMVERGGQGLTLKPAWCFLTPHSLFGRQMRSAGSGAMVNILRSRATLHFRIQARVNSHDSDTHCGTSMSIHSCACSFSTSGR
jgi:hypothetical protein